MAASCGPGRSYSARRGWSPIGRASPRPRRSRLRSRFLTYLAVRVRPIPGRRAAAQKPQPVKRGRPALTTGLTALSSGHALVRKELVDAGEVPATCGVSRLMAAVIHKLWARDDTGLLIMPASIPIYAPLVQAELTSRRGLDAGDRSPMSTARTPRNNSTSRTQSQVL